MLTHPYFISVEVQRACTSVLTSGDILFSAQDMLELEQQLMQLTEEFERELIQGGDSVVLQCHDHVVGMAQKAIETEHLLVLHHQGISVQLRAAVSELVDVARQGATELMLIRAEGQSQALPFDHEDNHRRARKDNHRHDDSRDWVAQALERRDAVQCGGEESEAPDPARQRVNQGRDDSRDGAAQALGRRDAVQCGRNLPVEEVEEARSSDQEDNHRGEREDKKGQKDNGNESKPDEARSSDQEDNHRREREDKGNESKRDESTDEVVQALERRDAVQCGEALEEDEESEALDSARQRACQSAEADEGKAEVVSVGEKVRKIAIQVGTLAVYMFLITSAYTGGGHAGAGGRAKTKTQLRGTTVLHRMFHVQAGEGAKAGTRVTKARHQTTWQQISNAAMFTHAKMASNRLGNVTAVKSILFEAAEALRSKEGKQRDRGRRRPAHGRGNGKSARMSPAAALLQVSRNLLASTPGTSSSEAQASFGAAQDSFCDQVPGTTASQLAIAEAQDSGEAPAADDTLVVHALVENEVPESGEVKVRNTQSDDAAGRVEMCEAQGGEMVRWRCVMPKKTTSTDATPPEEPRAEEPRAEPREVKAAPRWGSRISRAMRWPWRRAQASASAEREVQEREGWGEEEPQGKTAEGGLMHLVEDRVRDLGASGASEVMTTAVTVMDHLVCDPSEAETCPRRAVEVVGAVHLQSVENP